MKRAKVRFMETCYGSSLCSHPEPIVGLGYAWSGQKEWQHCTKTRTIQYIHLTISTYFDLRPPQGVFST